MKCVKCGCYEQVLKLIRELAKVTKLVEKDDKTSSKENQYNKGFVLGHLCACDDLKFRIKDLMKARK